MRALARRSISLVLLTTAALASWVCPVSAADVQLRIVPLLSPGTSDFATTAPPAGVNLLPNTTAWVAEIWATDLKDSASGATGLIAAYVDALYSPAVFPAVSVSHSASFPAFLGTEPTIDTARGRILNFGGVVPRIDEPRGIWPEWVRVGWVRYGAVEVPRPVRVDLAGLVGAGGIGCYGRSCGTVDFIGGAVVITPDVHSGVALILLCSGVSRVRRGA